MLDHLRNGRAEQARGIIRGGKGGKGDIGVVGAGAFTLQKYVSLLSAMSLKEDETAMLAFMHDAEQFIEFDCQQAAIYFGRFSRWLVKELLAECSSNIVQASRLPAHALENMGLCASQLVAQSGRGGLELNLLQVAMRF